MNDSDLWNGPTNAIWLIGSDGTYRPTTRMRWRLPDHMARYGSEYRVPYSGYAEIDFEIKGRHAALPRAILPPDLSAQVTDRNDPRSGGCVLPPRGAAAAWQVAVACTIGNLACPDPPAL
ncbi:MAG: hypothetical protein IPP33_16820 [Flavobacteriales bacterium]|nr:hypothetical protein [Flavobacteriales bacterium]